MRMDGGGDFDPEQKITKPRSTSTNQTLQSLQTPLISPFSISLPPHSPPKKTQTFFSCFAKKKQDSTKMEVAKDAFKTCCTGAICSGKPAATPMVQPLERTPPGTEAWIWKRYSESVNKSSNLGGNFGGLVGQVGWDLVVRWLVGWWVGVGTSVRWFG